MSARVLLVDIETSPMLLAGFGLFNQNFSLDQIIEDPRIMGFAAKWLDGPPARWWSEYHHGREAMLTKAFEMLDEADFVAGWNSRGFDEPWFVGEFAREGMGAPSPWKSIDLYKVSKRVMRFPSHKLAYVSKALVKDTKLSTGGFQLWRDCLWGDEETQRKAWSRMRRYCLQDTNLLQPLFDELRPYLPANINLAFTGGDLGHACPACGSDNLQRRGFQVTGTRRYARFQCQQCGKWSKANKCEPGETAGLSGVAR